MRSHSILRSRLRSLFGVALCLFTADYARAQSLDWVKQAGGTISTGGQSVEAATAIAVDSLGNSYITGTFRIEATFGAGEPNKTVLRGLGGQNIFVAKYDANGMLLWAKGAGGGAFFEDFSWGIAIDASGNSYVTGYFRAPVDFGNGVTLEGPGAFVVKYDTEGTVVWATTLDPNGVGYAIGVNADGDSFVAGVTPGPLPGLLPLVTVWKVGANGTTQWTRSAVGVYGGAAVGLSVDSTGNISVTGEVQGGTATFGAGELNETDISSPEGGVLFVARYGASGNLLWARQSSAATQAGASPRGNAISTDAAGSSYVAGVGSMILGPGGQNPTVVATASVAKYDGLGNLVWARSVAPPFGQVSWLFAIASNSAGDTYVTGTVIQGVIFIEKYSSSGDLLWSRRLAGVASVDALALHAAGISLDGAGNAYLAGQFSGTARFGPDEPHETLLSTTSGNLDFDVFLAKYLSDGPIQNVPPVADDQNVTTAEDTPLAIVLTAADADGDPLLYSIVIPPAHGDLSGTPPSVTYTPHLNFHGPDPFTFHVFDGDEFSNTATVTITVTPVNDAPVANDQALTTAEDTPVAVTLTGQDVDGDNLLFTVVSGPSHGTLAGNSPQLIYTPALDYVGPDSFTFTAFDGAATSAPATVAITVGLTSISCGTLTSGTITAAGEVDRYTFTGQVGQIVNLALASTGGFPTSHSLSSAGLTVFAPSGAVVGSLRSNNQGTFTLPETGTYVIRVSAVNLATTGSYNFSLHCLRPPSPGTPLLQCGALQSGTIGVPGEVDLYSFTGEAGNIVNVALASTGGFPTSHSLSSAGLTVFAPSGAIVGSLRSNNQGTFTLPPETGIYVVRVSSVNLATTGSYNVSLHCLRPPSPGTPLLQCGALQSGTIEAPGEVDLYSFTGEAGRIVNLALASTGGFPTSHSLSSAGLTVFAPSGAIVGSLRSNNQGTFTLLETGTYAVRVSSVNLATTGSYNVSLHCLRPPSPGTPLLQCGALQSGTIEALGEVDLYSFTGEAGRIVNLALASTGGFPTNRSLSSAGLTVFAPSGAVVGSLRSNNQGTFTLPETGTYAVRVSSVNLATTGSYDLRLLCP